MHELHRYVAAMPFLLTTSSASSQSRLTGRLHPILVHIFVCNVNREKQNLQTICYTDREDFTIIKWHENSYNHGIAQTRRAVRELITKEKLTLGREQCCNSYSTFIYKAFPGHPPSASIVVTEYHHCIGLTVPTAANGNFSANISLQSNFKTFSQEKFSLYTIVVRASLYVYTMVDSIIRVIHYCIYCIRESSSLFMCIVYAMQMSSKQLFKGTKPL